MSNMTKFENIHDHISNIYVNFNIMQYFEKFEVVVYAIK